MIYQAVSDLVNRGETIAFVQVVRKKGSAPRGTGAKMIVCSDGTSIGTIGGGPLEYNAIQAAISCIVHKENKMLSYDLSGKSQANLNMHCGGIVDIYIEVIVPEPTLLIIGAGHVGQSLARLASELAWTAILFDERQDLLAAMPASENISTIWGETYVQSLNAVSINSNMAIVIVTKDSDLEVLRQVIGTSAFYIGMMGSKNKIDFIKRTLMAEGVLEESLNKVNAPIGIPIQTETPAEIAVSILAAVIDARYKKHLETATEVQNTSPFNPDSGKNRLQANS